MITSINQLVEHIPFPFSLPAKAVLSSMSRDQKIELLSDVNDVLENLDNNDDTKLRAVCEKYNIPYDQFKDHLGKIVNGIRE